MAVCRGALVATSLLTAGCWLPVSYTERASPVVVGRYLQHDGTPAARARVAVTGEADDAHCSQARAHTRTDSTGSFRLTATTLRRRGIWLVPAIERFGNSYWVCAAAADSLLHMAYGGSTLRLASEPLDAPDSLACIEWAWQGESRVSCTGPDEPAAIQAGGTWAEGDATGLYRLVVVPTAYDAREPGVFLQWVETPGAGRIETVRKTVSLPLAAKLIRIDEAKLWLEGERAACVTVHSTGSGAGKWTHPRKRVSFELGSPGQMHEVPHCRIGSVGSSEDQDPASSTARPAASSLQPNDVLKLMALVRASK